MFDIISDVIEVFIGKKPKISDYFKNLGDTEYKKPYESDISKKNKNFKGNNFKYG